MNQILSIRAGWQTRRRTSKWKCLRSVIHRAAINGRELCCFLLGKNKSVFGDIVFVIIRFLLSESYWRNQKNGRVHVYLFFSISRKPLIVLTWRLLTASWPTTTFRKHDRRTSRNFLFLTYSRWKINEWFWNHLRRTLYVQENADDLALLGHSWKIYSSNWTRCQRLRSLLVDKTKIGLNTDQSAKIKMLNKV